MQVSIDKENKKAIVTMEVDIARTFLGVDKMLADGLSQQKIEYEFSCEVLRTIARQAQAHHQAVRTAGDIDAMKVELNNAAAEASDLAVAVDCEVVDEKFKAEAAARAQAGVVIEEEGK